jgi:RNA polymerase sigma factor (sigma-70 family)
VAELCAMTELYPEKYPKDAWNVYRYRIECLTKDALTRMSGPTGYEKHYWTVLDKVETEFFSSFEKNLRRQDLVQAGSARDRSLKIQKATHSEAFWISIPNLVDRVVENFVTLERKRLWEAHKAIVISNLQEVLPAAARQFETYYTQFFLSQFVLRWFNYWFPEGRSNDQLEEWLKILLKEVVATELPKLINDKGELIDEELVRLYRNGLTEGKSILLERYVARLGELVPAIVYSKDLCPEFVDSVEFVKDVAHETWLKLEKELDSYRFESSFRTWVGTICENEAKTQKRKLAGRSKKGLREYVSFEELQHEPQAPIRNEGRSEILHKIIDKHRKQGVRAAKSSDAIEWRHFDEMDTRAIAERLNTTVAYVHQLYSHDYPEMRRIGLEDFGISGTDL